MGIKYTNTKTSLEPVSDQTIRQPSLTVTVTTTPCIVPSISCHPLLDEKSKAGEAIRVSFGTGTHIKELSLCLFYLYLHEGGGWFLPRSLTLLLTHVHVPGSSQLGTPNSKGVGNICSEKYRVISAHSCACQYNWEECGN